MQCARKCRPPDSGDRDAGVRAGRVGGDMSEAEKLQKIAQIMLEKEKKEKEVAALNRMIAELLGISSTETMKLPNKVYSSNQFKAACRGAK